MYTHSNPTGPRVAVNHADTHAVDPQTFDVVNGRQTVICGLCGGVARPWVTDHAAGWIHA